MQQGERLNWLRRVAAAAVAAVAGPPALAPSAVSARQCTGARRPCSTPLASRMQSPTACRTCTLSAFPRLAPPASRRSRGCRTGCPRFRCRSRSLGPSCVRVPGRRCASPPRRPRTSRRARCARRGWVVRTGRRWPTTSRRSGCRRRWSPRRTTRARMIRRSRSSRWGSTCSRRPSRARCARRCARGATRPSPSPAALARRPRPPPSPAALAHRPRRRAGARDAARARGEARGRVGED